MDFGSAAGPSTNQIYVNLYWKLGAKWGIISHPNQHNNDEILILFDAFCEDFWFSFGLKSGCRSHETLVGRGSENGSKIGYPKQK